MGRWKPEVANRTLRARRCGSDSHSRRLGTVRWSRRLLVIKRRAPTAGGGVRDPPALLRSSARGGGAPPAQIRTSGGGRRVFGAAPPLGEPPATTVDHARSPRAVRGVVRDSGRGGMAAPWFAFPSTETLTVFIYVCPSLPCKKWRRHRSFTS